MERISPEENLNEFQREIWAEKHSTLLSNITNDFVVARVYHRIKASWHI